MADFQTELEKVGTCLMTGYSYEQLVGIGLHNPSLANALTAVAGDYDCRRILGIMCAVHTIKRQETGK